MQYARIVFRFPFLAYGTLVLLPGLLCLLMLAEMQLWLKGHMCGAFAFIGHLFGACARIGPASLQACKFSLPFQPTRGPGPLTE